MAKALALFDFDGTLTFKDSLGDFISFSIGKRKMVSGGIVLLPTLVSYALGLMNNSNAKQRVLKYFFAGMSIEKMHLLGQSYAAERLPNILRQAGLEKIKWHQKQGHKVVIVSASSDLWLKPWTDALGVDLIATQLEVEGGKMTGCYAGENCHGQEKVRLIQAAYNLATFEEIYAYGDTSGDKPMLGLANYAFYKPFL